jgi:fructose-1,6-bisphosphatase/inositol monophosphatase family enzyme
VPIRVIAEEHGTVDITPNPTYLGVLDGLDGTNRYQAGRGVERYGTMFGVFSSLNPTYADYLSSGIMEHSTGKLFIANKGAGSFVVTKGEKQSIHASGREHLDENTKIYINQYWEMCRELFSEKLGPLPFSDPRAYAAYFSDLASGAVDLVVSSTGKGNLELAIGYGLITEAGGVLVDIHGESLGKKKYLEFGQEEQLAVIASSSEQLARELIEYI